MKKQQSRVKKIKSNQRKNRLIKKPIYFFNKFNFS